MDKLLHEIVAYIESRDRTTIRICGHGGSGKTVFAEKLCQILEDETYNLLATDPYIILNQYSQDAKLIYEVDGEAVTESITACHPLRHELASLRRDIRTLNRQKDLWTIHVPWQEEILLQGKRPVTIVEGMSATFLEKDLFDLSIFLYTDEETELKRRLDRDTQFRGRDENFIRETHKRRRRQYDLYMSHLAKEFDIVINQSKNKFCIEKKVAIV